MRQTLSPNWFDLIVVVVIAFGILRGRKRGMSEELLDVLQWLCIVFAGSFTYKSLGIFIATYTHIDVWVGFILAYISVVVLVKLLFAGIKRMMGEKLLQADTFGSFEYYLGMIAGAVRYACILLVFLSLLNGYYVSDAERARNERVQQESFGFTLIPTPGLLQQIIFRESISGKFIKKNLVAELIQPVPPGERGETIARRRERAVDEVMDPRRK